MATQVQTLDEAVCITDSTNIHGKGMNSTILLAMGRLGFLFMVQQTNIREEKLNSNLLNSTLKN